MNQKHEVDVCLGPHRALAVSEFPWQAGFGLCQNLELWHNSVDLPVRPGLRPSCCSNQSPGVLWLLPLLLPTLESPPGQNGRRRLHSPVPCGRKMAHSMVSWSAVKASVPLGAWKPKHRKLWRREPSAGRAVGNTEERGWTGGRETRPGPTGRRPCLIPLSMRGGIQTEAGRVGNGRG